MKQIRTGFFEVPNTFNLVSRGKQLTIKYLIERHNPEL